MYGKVKISNLLLQDNAVTVFSSRAGAQDNSSRVETIMKSKQLDINITKSVMLLCCSKANKEKLAKEIDDNPVVYDNNAIKVKQNDKWLGDIIDSNGDSASITATISARKGRIINSIHEIIAIIEDTRMQRIGGLQCGLDLFEIVLIPSLLSNSSCWQGLLESHLKELDELQDYFLQRLFQVPKSTPKPALLRHQLSENDP